MHKLFIPLLAICLLFTAGCGDQSKKIDEVKQTVVPDCRGKTMQDLASDLLQNPVWGFEKAPDGKKSVTLKGVLVEDKLPGWAKEQKMMEVTFRFPLDPKSETFDPKALDEFPLFTAGCDQFKIDRVKQTVVPDCKGKTMQDLASGLLQDPAWDLEKTPDGKKSVTLKGTLVGDKLPGWVKEQNMMEITFRFPLDPKSETFDPKTLGGFPSLTAPEGVFQTYKLLVCE